MIVFINLIINFKFSLKLLYELVHSRLKFFFKYKKTPNSLNIFFNITSSLNCIKNQKATNADKYEKNPKIIKFKCCDYFIYLNHFKLEGNIKPYSHETDKLFNITKQTQFFKYKKIPGKSKLFNIFYF